MTARKLFLEVDGRTVKVLRGGRGKWRLIFLHGLAGKAEVWKKQLSAFSSSHEVLALDLLGHGGSSSVAPDDALRANAALLSSLLKRLPQKTTTVVAHSLGGSVLAESIATGAPIDDAVFVDSPCIRNAKILNAYHSFGRRIGAADDPAKAMESSFAEYLTHDCGREARTLVMDAVQACDPSWISRLLLSLRVQRRPVARMPVTVMEGRQYFPPGSESSWLRFFPQARSWRYSGRGHFFFLEDPASFNRALEASILPRARVRAI